ncbi:hypothetical protein SPLC1_S040510 [Arthrospira platensis C1]|uniref:Uncharacterized protein n=1 Tax=Limnospira indica PCC 8005 TaxID=376219 RepID=A0A9P1NXH7_9CYAN|nr:hypothetical protein SPLC1_S040480 [Arthrospira platensis C1]EKD11052.1 hypothetical protein SPLC1_S040490 [Arthrospira platensis C1]EKD11053.1 hypothetical protein SPLC1_S040500 [Arthrospira platensis C1]EKD11054.1 hypothetical protein SPLC1_S040510 [Arthrospira platensis C1]CDM93733.1 conserved protein of unknown function [Limnospira indica PCC 8005]
MRHLTHRIVLLKKPGFDRRNQETRFLKETGFLSRGRGKIDR